MKKVSSIKELKTQMPKLPPAIEEKIWLNQEEINNEYQIEVSESMLKSYLVSCGVIDQQGRVVKEHENNVRLYKPYNSNEDEKLLINYKVYVLVAEKLTSYEEEQKRFFFGPDPSHVFE